MPDTFSPCITQVWKKSANISQLEALLAEKHDEMTENSALLAKVQHNNATLEEELKAARQKVKSLQMEVERCRASEQQNQATHAAQCRQYERQMEMVSRVQVWVCVACRSLSQCCCFCSFVCLFGWFWGCWLLLLYFGGRRWLGGGGVSAC